MAFHSLYTSRRKLLAGSLVGLLAWMLAVTIYLPGLLESFELKAYDHLCRLLPPHPPPGEVALVVLDQGSLEAAQDQGIGWPWPRQMYRPIVEFCTRAGARAVVFDILYTEPSVYGVEDDRLLAEAMERNGKVFLPIFLSRDKHRQAEWQGRLVQDMALPLENLSGLPFLSYHSAVFPIRTLAQSAAGFGNVDIPPDPDGIYRRLPLVSSYGEHWLPSLGFAVLRHLQNGDRLVLERGALTRESGRIPLDARGNLLLSFYGRENAYPRYSAINIIQSSLALEGGEKPIYPPETFRNKVVFVGYTAPGLYDLKPTPVSPVYPGVAIQATLVANVLNDDFRVRIKPAALLPLAAGVALLTGITVMLVANFWQLGLFVLAYGAGLIFVVAVSFAHDVWVDGIFLVGSFFLAFSMTAAFSYATEGRQRRQIKRMFSHYMSDLLIQDLLKNPDKLRLGGEKRVLTVLFSDLAGFTTLSENLSPEEVVALLNRYLTAMTDIILASGGLIDKYEGDAIMAFWGAPVIQDDHAARACLAALDNQRRLSELRRDFASTGLPAVYSRIGINTGEMIIGNMGSDQRFDFTVMGDSVNLAARLEGAGKAYGVGIIISEETYRQAAEQVEVRELDLLRVKGKARPVRIYELLARKGELDGDLTRVRALFAEGLDLYRSSKWTEAMERFEQASSIAPGDGPSRVFIERCREFIEKPPPSSWDGVYEMTSK